MDEGLVPQLVEFLDDVGINTGKHIVTKGNVMIGCPFASVNDAHKSDIDTRPSMGLKFGKKGFLYHCFTCRTKGTGIIDFVDKLRGYKLIELSDDTTLLKFMRSSLPSYGEEIEKEVEKKERDIQLNKFVKLRTKNNFDLIKGKKLSKHINKLNVLITRDIKLMYNKRKNELTFPCYDINNNFIGVVRKAKYNYINEVDVDDLLYLEWLIKGKIGIVTEGMFDATVIYKYLSDLDLLDKYSSVSLFGAEFSDNQLKRLIRFFDRIIIMGDNDNAGISLEKNLVKAIDGRIPTYRIIYNGSDPAEIRRSDFRKLIKYPLLFNAIEEKKKLFYKK